MDYMETDRSGGSDGEDGDEKPLDERVEAEILLYRTKHEQRFRILECQRAVLQEVLLPLLPKGCSLVSVYRSLEPHVAANDRADPSCPWVRVQLIDHARNNM